MILFNPVDFFCFLTFCSKSLSSKPHAISSIALLSIVHATGGDALCAISQRSIKEYA
jgi:hypothetical protein